jgi:ankyrin repeat protein
METPPANPAAPAAAGVTIPLVFSSGPGKNRGTAIILGIVGAAFQGPLIQLTPGLVHSFSLYSTLTIFVFTSSGVAILLYAFELLTRRTDATVDRNGVRLSTSSPLGKSERRVAAADVLRIAPQATFISGDTPKAYAVSLAYRDEQGLTRVGNLTEGLSSADEANTIAVKAAALLGLAPDAVRTAKTYRTNFEGLNVAQPAFFAWLPKAAKILPAILFVAFAADFARDYFFPNRDTSPAPVSANSGNKPVVTANQAPQSDAGMAQTDPAEIFQNPDNNPYVDALNKNDLAMVQVLAQQHVDPNVPNASGDNALAMAASHGKTEFMKAMIAAGADANFHNPVPGRRAGMTPLMYAVMSRSLPAMQALADAGARISEREAQGLTPLHIAAMNGSTEGIGFLIGRGADVNAHTQGYRYETPLMFAAQYNKPEVIDMLVKAGADINVLDRYKKNAIDYALFFHRQGVFEQLCALGAAPTPADPTPPNSEFNKRTSCSAARS